jgi:hypothetical protein
MPRPPAPGTSLADRFPTIAATWDQEANGERTPADVAAGAGALAHWVCPAGHRWSEKVAQRTKDAQWKRGNAAACRLCSGHYVEVAFSCGHTLTIPAWRAPRAPRPCNECRSAAYETKRVAYEQNRDEILAACRAEAGSLAEQLWRERGYHKLAVPLRQRAQTKLRGAITYSLVGQRSFGADPISPKLLQTLHELDQLLEGAPRDPGDRPVLILGEAFWGRALSEQPQPPARPELDTLASLELAAAATLQQPPPFGAEQGRVPDMTWWMTAAIREWAHRLGWVPYGEVRLPLVGDERESGRLDLIVYRTRLPELVIELDSNNSPRSVAKLERARDLGALPVWIRWHRGSARAVGGVYVVDLTGCRADAA